MQNENLKKIAESLIFASDYPISTEKISSIINSKDATNSVVLEIINKLNREYKETGRAFEIINIGGGYRFSTLKTSAEYIKQLFKGRRKPKLSRAALETLSIIAYKQPVSGPVIESIRGVSINGVINTLLERRLVSISGREKKPGRPLIYSTTHEFLNCFGLNDISDLPDFRELNDILSQKEVTENDETE